MGRATTEKRERLISLVNYFFQNRLTSQELRVSIQFRIFDLFFPTSQKNFDQMKVIQILVNFHVRVQKTSYLQGKLKLVCINELSHLNGIAEREKQ